MSDKLSLVSLEVQNVLRLKAFKMSMGPDGVVVIEAKNEQGKSSAVKSLEMALAGMSDAPPDPLHGDAKKGHIIATFDGIVVKRVFRAGKPPALTITNADGTRVKGPQTLLDTLINRRCLRPTKIMEASDKEQVAIVSEIMGFDSKPHDAEIERVFNLRADANREAKRLKAVADATTFHEDAPDAEVSVSELLAEMDVRRKHNAGILDLNMRIEKHSGSRARSVELACDCEVRIAKLEAELLDERKTLMTRQDLIGKDEAAIAMHSDARVKMSPADETEIAQQLASADEVNAMVRDNIERERAVKEAKAAALDASGYDKDLDAEKAKRNAARMEARDRLPMPGLDISEDCVLYNGKPFSQAGASAQLRICVAVAIAGNEDKRVRMLAIDNAEKLDADGQRMVLEMARDSDYQVIMTKVIQRTEDASESSVVIEDGEVVE